MKYQIFSALAFTAVAFFGVSGLGEVDEGQVLGKLKTINQTEIKVGQWAAEKATINEIKEYGRQLVKDHKNLDAQIHNFAATNKITVADIQPSEEDKAAVESLQQATGADFDKKFLDTMVKGHEDAVSMVRTAKDDTQDSKFKNFLAKVVPSLEKHYKTAEKIEKKASM